MTITQFWYWSAQAEARRGQLGRIGGQGLTCRFHDRMPTFLTLNRE
jgi:hypothetical protein